jgi:hypothetical protein
LRMEVYPELFNVLGVLLIKLGEIVIWLGEFFIASCFFTIFSLLFLRLNEDLSIFCKSC